MPLRPLRPVSRSGGAVTESGATQPDAHGQGSRKDAEDHVAWPGLGMHGIMDSVSVTIWVLIRTDQNEAQNILKPVGFNMTGFQMIWGHWTVGNLTTQPFKK